jgi:two-component system alkaline phosphatase synthesis response regulator PhoP
MKPTILIIEDDVELAHVLKRHLEREGRYAVEIARTGEEGLRALLVRRPSALILDVNLPEMNGFELCQRLRLEEATRRLPILLLTARTSESDKVLGLNLGADDYVTKPFSLRELEARVRALLRRTQEEEEPPYDDGTLYVDPAHFIVRVEGREVKLTRKEFELLALLVRHPDRTLTREYLLDRIWGLADYGHTRTLDVHVRNLRKKLGQAVCIETVVGVGYRFRPRPPGSL